MTKQTNVYCEQCGDEIKGQTAEILSLNTASKKLLFFCSESCVDDYTTETIEAWENERKLTKEWFNKARGI